MAGLTAVGGVGVIGPSGAPSEHGQRVPEPAIETNAGSVAVRLIASALSSVVDSGQLLDVSA